MNLTEHTDMGLRALVLLATVAPERVSAAVIAKRHRVSYAHVQKVVQNLQGAGFIHTFRGRGGGVQLARPAEEIRIGAVVRALEPHFHLAECFAPGTPRCVLAGGCALTHTLRRGMEAMLTELDRVTLAEIVATSPRTALLRASHPGSAPA